MKGAREYDSVQEYRGFNTQIVHIGIQTADITTDVTVIQTICKSYACRVKRCVSGTCDLDISASFFIVYL